MRIGGYLSATTNRFSTDNHNLPLHNYVRNLISSLSFSFLSKRLKQMQKRSFFWGGGGGRIYRGIQLSIGPSFMLRLLVFERQVIIPCLLAFC